MPRKRRKPRPEPVKINCDLLTFAIVENDPEIGIVAEAQDADGNMVGHVSADFYLVRGVRKHIQVEFSGVKPGARRCGVGTKLYEMVARKACRTYRLKLRSDTTRSHFAEGFWRKQERKGRARCLRLKVPAHVQPCEQYELKSCRVRSLRG